MRPRLSLQALIPIQEVLFHTYIKVSMFSSYNFSVSGFTFGSLIHLELGSFLCKVMGIGLISFFYVWTIQFLQHHLLKMFSFL